MNNDGSPHRTKTQYYSANGAGRDSYIYGDNGGFCPPKQPCKIEDLGTFQFLKQRPAHNLAYIHSKPVVYVNNGGGRDTYISHSSGGLRLDYRPAHGKRTFYSNLRQYDQIAQPNRNKSHTATAADRRDVLSNTQNKFNDKFQRNACLVKNYQNMLDLRLSQPKGTEHLENGRVFRNSHAQAQASHQNNTYRKSVTQMDTVQEMDPLDPGRTMDQHLATYTKVNKRCNTINM